MVPADNTTDISEVRDAFAWYLLCDTKGREFLQEAFLPCAFESLSDIPSSISDLLTESDPEACDVYDKVLFA